MPAWSRPASARAALLHGHALSIGDAALLVDGARLLDAWLTVAALSSSAAAADPGSAPTRALTLAALPGHGKNRSSLSLDRGSGGERRRRRPARSATTRLSGRGLRPVWGEGS